MGYKVEIIRLPARKGPLDFMSTIGLVVFGRGSLLALMSLLPPVAAKLRLPYSVLLAVIGFILGLVVSLRPDQAVPAPVLRDIFDALASVEISSEAFILIFLPTLLFETALAIDVRRLLDDLAPVLTLAVVAVVSLRFWLCQCKFISSL